MRILFLVAALTCFFTSSFSQNYLGYSKQFIVKALKSQRKDMVGPVIVKAVNDNFIFYTTKDGSRIVYYYFNPVTVTLENGKVSQEEICIKYLSKTKCQGYFNCPEMDEVVRSFESHFTKVQELIWVDYTKTVPHEWVIVRDDDYFEVHVSELKE